MKFVFDLRINTQACGTRASCYKADIQTEQACYELIYGLAKVQLWLVKYCFTIIGSAAEGKFIAEWKSLVS